MQDQHRADRQWRNDPGSRDRRADGQHQEARSDELDAKLASDAHHPFRVSRRRAPSACPVGRSRPVHAATPRVPRRRRPGVAERTASTRGSCAASAGQERVGGRVSFGRERASRLGRSRRSLGTTRESRIADSPALAFAWLRARACAAARARSGRGPGVCRDRPQTPACDLKPGAALPGSGRTPDPLTTTQTVKGSTKPLIAASGTGVWARRKRVRSPNGPRGTAGGPLIGPC